MKPEEVKKIQIAMSTPFPWGKWKKQGLTMDQAPSSALKWTAEKWGDDEIATRADTVWQWREGAGLHWYD